MKLRPLALNAFELIAGPYVFLVSHCIPVAYRDLSPGASPPGLYRTDKRFSKSVTRHVNTWLEKKGRYSTLPHELIVQVFEGISRFSGGEITVTGGGRSRRRE